MAYHIKSQNVFGNDTYIKGEDTSAEKDLRWTEDFSDRKVFPTLFQAEQDKNTTYTDKWGNTLTPHWWKNCTLVDE